MKNNEEEREKEAQKRFDEELAKEARNEVIKLERTSKKEFEPKIDKKIFEKLKKANTPEEILSSGLDTLGSLNFLKKEKTKFVKKGYRTGPLMDTYLGLSVIARRLRISIELTHKEMFETSPVGTTEDMDKVKELETLAKTMTDIKKTLEREAEKEGQAENIFSLHNKTVKEAEEFIEKHVGEYAITDGKKILDMAGRAHFAFARLNGWDEKTPLVWSEEGGFLVKKGYLKPEILAFLLMTSPEGLKKMAEIRGIKLDFDLEETEKKLEKLQNEFEKEYGYEL